MQQIAKTYYDTPLGTVAITASNRGISSLTFTEHPTAEIDPTHDLLMECIEQLEAYFSGERTHFTVFLDMGGTDFQRRVWRELTQVSYGTTLTYLQLAKKIQAPDAVRAVGGACSKNQHWLLIPCHRVLGSNGQLTGYAGGLRRKRWLIQHEWGVLHGKQAVLF